MTSVSLHTPPRASGIAREQVRATAVGMRREAIGFAALWLVFFALGLRAAFASAASGRTQIMIGFQPATGLPVVILALLVPFSVWRGEDPARRSYHWAMPIPRLRHAIVKVAAGLLWMWVAVAAYLAFIVLLALSISAITHAPRHLAVRPWEWIVPFTGSAVTYLAGSAVVVGLRRPWRWMMAGIPAALMVAVFPGALGLSWLQDAATTAWRGWYGLSPALGANVLGLDGHSNLGRWAGATALWIALALVALLLAARRHIEDA